MSAQKRTTVRSKKTAPKTARKAVVKRARKVAKKTAKKVVKKTVKKTVKKVAKKTAKKTSKRTRKKVTAPQTVKEARYGGHQNTVPKNPKAPGRILGRSFTLSLLSLGHVPFNTDMIAVSLARVGGVAIMMAGLALSWNIFNQLAVTPEATQSAAVYESQSTSMTVSITQEQPLEGEVPIIISATNADDVILALEQGTSTTILGAAHQQTRQTWQYLLDTTALTDGTYQLSVLLATDTGYYRVPHENVLTLANQPAVESEIIVTEESSTSSLAVASSSVATSTSSNSTTTAVAMAPVETESVGATTSMPVLFAPSIRMLAPLTDTKTLVVGEGTPDQPVELLFLREQQRATTTVQSNGWWQLTITTPTRADAYELYAQASPELSSQPLDFTVIAGSLRTAAPQAEQVTTVSASNPQREMFLWYLLASITIMCVGAVLLLIGHHLHHTRPKPGDEIPKLDRAA